VKPLRIAIVGALGAVGQEMIKVLESSKLEVSVLKPLDIAVNTGKTIQFRGIALFSAGASASEILAPVAVAEGAVVIDNSSQWRMDPKVPLVIPEVNPEALKDHRGLIANPNCSTIQMLVALKPLHTRYSIKRIVVSTYQAVSGSGAPAIAELRSQTKDMLDGIVPKAQVYPYAIGFNVLPHIDVFLENGYTKEEMKMVNETHKMLDPSIMVSPTAVRVPVFRGHSESINVEFEKSYELDDVRELLMNSPGVEVVDDISIPTYPLAIESEGRDAVFVGRIRRDETVENGLNLWVVSDNLRKGAALNAVQIAEKLVEMDLLKR